MIVDKFNYKQGKNVIFEAIYDLEEKEKIETGSLYFGYYKKKFSEIHVGDYVKIKNRNIKYPKNVNNKIGKVALISKEMQLPYLVELEDETGFFSGTKGKFHSAFSRNQLTLLTPEEKELYLDTIKYNL